MNNKFFKNFSWLFSAKIFQMLIQLFLGIFVARYLGPDNYGSINYVASFVSFFTAVTLVGVNSVGVDEFVESKDNQIVLGKKIGSIIFARFIIGFFSSLLVVISICLINGNSDGVIFIAVLQSLALLFICLDTFNYWFQARQELKYPAIVQLITYAIVALYKIILLMTNKSIYWFAFSNSVDVMILAILYILVYKKEGGPKLSIDLRFLKLYLKRSYHFIIAGIMAIIYTQIDKVMLGSMVNTTAVGLYSAVIVICNMWTIVVNSILDIARPIIMNAKNINNEFLYRKRLTQTISVLLYMGLICGTVISFSAEFVLWVLYGKSFVIANSALKLAVWFTCFANIGSVLHIYFVCERREHYVDKFCIGGAIVNVLLNLILIPKLGIMGAAIATLITQIFTNVILTIFIRDTRLFFKCFLLAFIEVKSIVGMAKNLLFYKKSKKYIKEV